jgi:hypothetical protein
MHGMSFECKNARGARRNFALTGLSSVAFAGMTGMTD